jgi:hypothetical protein
VFVTELPARNAVVTANQFFDRRTSRSSPIWHKKLDASATNATTSHHGSKESSRGHDETTDTNPGIRT